MDVNHDSSFVLFTTNTYEHIWTVVVDKRFCERGNSTRAGDRAMKPNLKRQLPIAAMPAHY